MTAKPQSELEDTIEDAIATGEGAEGAVIAGLTGIPAGGGP